MTKTSDDDFSSQVEPFVEAFGDQGYVFFGKGLSLAECYKDQLSQLETEIDELQKAKANLEKENADLQAKLDQVENLASDPSRKQLERKTLADTPTGKLATALLKQ